MVRTILYTILALLAFAGNSLLNRAALAEGAIDWDSFTIIRLISGALVLAILLAPKHGRAILPRLTDSWAIVSLFVYAAAFSFAYSGVSAGLGALILFGFVQITMNSIAIAQGHRPSALQWFGLVLAFAGLVWLLLPGLSAPPLVSAISMGAAGIAWGFYSKAGQGSKQPAVATARNFIGTLPLLLLLFFAWQPEAQYQQSGIILAVASGAVTSALGYIIWYAALPRLSTMTAGVAQLLVPSIAAFGGVLLLDEMVTNRLVGATSLIVVGILLTLRKPKHLNKAQ